MKVFLNTYLKTWVGMTLLILIYKLIFTNFDFSVGYVTFLLEMTILSIPITGLAFLIQNIKK